MFTSKYAFACAAAAAFGFANISHGSAIVTVTSSLGSTFTAYEGSPFGATWWASYTSSDTLQYWGSWTTSLGGSGSPSSSYSNFTSIPQQGTYSLAASTYVGFTHHDFWSGDQTYSVNGSTTTAVTVLNVAPTIQSLTGDLTANIGETFNFAASATDPGINDVLTFAWDLDNNGSYDNATGTSGSTSFSTLGDHPVNMRVADGDGGFDYDSFTVTVVPEPGTPALLGLAGLALLARRSRRLA